MSLQTAVNKALDELFDGYTKHGGTRTFSINEVVEKEGENPEEVGRYLVKNGWVKNQQFRFDGFLASITIEGIKKVDPDYINDRREKVLSTLGLLGGEGWGNIIEVLDYDPKDFQIAFDLAKEFELDGIIEAQYQAREIFIKLTVEGKIEYEEKKPRFL